MRFVTEEMAAWHARAGLPIAAYSATSGGYFSGAARQASLYDSADNRARRERARQLAARMGYTPTQIALAYLMHQSPTVLPIFGTTSTAHLEDALGSLDVSLTPSDVRWLRDGDPST
jgi:aryl-alcohol dehydrogenase-like predicted oxidoreductase